MYTPPVISRGPHWEPPHTLSSKPVLQFLMSLHLWTLKGSRWRGALKPSLWPSQVAVLWSAFSVLFSSWRLHCGGGAPAERVPTLVLGSTQAWVFSSQFIEKRLTPEGLISDSVRTASPLANSFTHSPSMAKFPYWRVTNSSILEYTMSILVILI